MLKTASGFPSCPFEVYGLTQQIVNGERTENEG